MTELPDADWTFFREALLNWYDPSARPMPWKQERNPYLIWLSEIILQQTRVEQGLAYFEKFRRHYPTVFDLAAADDQAVMKDWEGLGYYSRARNLLKAARLIVAEMDGVFPGDASSLLHLPGVGPYTAAAIASFAYDEAVPVLDGNVFRILARFSATASAIDSSRGKHEFSALAVRALGEAAAATYNQAIMDFGALVCTPKRANCMQCPLRSRCRAFAGDLVDSLPVKEKKIKKKTRYFQFLVLTDSAGRYLIQQRKESDIWRDLFQFPLLETGQQTVTTQQLLASNDWPSLLPPEQLVFRGTYPPRKQQLTHQTIIGSFHVAKLQMDLPVSGNYEWVTETALSNYAFPKMLASFIAEKAVFLDLFSE